MRGEGEGYRRLKTRDAQRTALVHCNQRCELWVVGRPVMGNHDEGAARFQAAPSPSSLALTLAVQNRTRAVTITFRGGCTKKYDVVPSVSPLV